MDLNEAKQRVCDAGKQLLKEGLVARTWGNVSVKINDHQMVITPSGRQYTDLTPNDMVVVDFNTYEYTGRIKPSSELKLHCEVYKTRPSIQCVIHTHQLYASIVASAQVDVPILNKEYQEILGASIIKSAPYALPNTKKITVETARAMEGSFAALMANHGAVCCGDSLEDVFLKCTTLEAACQEFITSKKQVA
ncbi:MAG: class II aldolase/adducin family protein [Chitinophagales bacterium]